jgi:hypothetical protein
MIFEKAKTAIKDELTKSIVEVTTCSDPAPMPVPGSGAAKVLKALSEDIKDMVKNQSPQKNRMIIAAYLSHFCI